MLGGRKRCGKMRVSTETGSYYDIDLDVGLWSKNSAGRQSLWEYAAVPDWQDKRSEVMNVGLVEWSRKHGRMFEIPKVGECLYIMGRDTWWLSTRVTSIEE